MAHPLRIQRKRTKGYKMPEGAVYVGRPTKWGNPFRVGEFDEAMGRAITPGMAARLFRMVWTQTAWWSTVTGPATEELRGKQLACWCPLDQPCHADVLAELANQ